MNESRTLRIADRRFRREDLLRIGRVFEDQHSESTRKSGRCTLRVSIKAEDETVYQSDSLDLLSEASDALLKRPVFVELAYTDYEAGRSLRFNATQGGSGSDRIAADGDPGWVRDVFGQLQDRLSAAPPTALWITRHPYLVRTTAKLGLGSIVQLAFEFVLSRVFAHLSPPSPELIAALNSSPVALMLLRPLVHPVVLFTWNWIARWIFGNAVWLIFSDWFWRAYPDVDLDFGPEHMNREKVRRHRLEFLAVTVAIPLVVAFVYDVIKLVFKSA